MSKFENLDEFIATKIMKYCSDRDTALWKQKDLSGKTLLAIDKTEFKPTRNMSQAWDALNRWCRRHGMTSKLNTYHDGSCRVEIIKTHGPFVSGDCFHAEAETGPLAICEALMESALR